MKSKRILLSFLFVASFLFAENEEDEQQLMNQAFVDLAKPENLKTFKEVRENKSLVEDEFLKLREIEVSAIPENMKLSDTNFISIHPEMPKTVIYSDVKITDLTAYPSGAISAIIDENNLNMIELKISHSFRKGVVVVKYLDKNNFRKVSNLMVETFDAKRNKKIYLTTNIKDYSQLKAVELIKKYQKLYGTNPVNSSSIVVDNEVYRFVEDRVNGFVTIGNKKFIIEHSFK